jgi:hypothetical protein
MNSIRIAIALTGRARILIPLYVTGRRVKVEFPCRP